MSEKEHTQTLSPAVVAEILDDMARLSGLMLWHVTGTWAHNGRTGEIDSIVEARTAIEAIRLAWGVESDSDLRTINAKWLGPIECVIKKNTSSGGVV